MLWEPKWDPITLFLCTCPAKTLPLHPTRGPNAQRRVEAVSLIPAQGCHLLAESGLAEQDPCRGWGWLVCAEPEVASLGLEKII